MTATLNDVTKKKPAESSAEQQAATELVRLARERGLSLTGPDGLLKQLTKTVIETALSEEMTEHLGYEKHDAAVHQACLLRQAEDRVVTAATTLNDKEPVSAGRDAGAARRVALGGPANRLLTIRRPSAGGSPWRSSQRRSGRCFGSR